MLILGILLHAALEATHAMVVPQPASVKISGGTFQPDSRIAISASGELMDVADYLRGKVAPATGWEWPITRRSGSDTVELRLDRRLSRLGPEGYTLEIRDDRVTIRSAAKAGVFYGVQTLRQIFPPDIMRRAAVRRHWSLPQLVIEDSPRFGWRGAHMDVSRHFMPKEFVLKFIDLMALHKLNVFHWHLVDDNGWRIQINAYPRLTEIGSRTDFSQMNPAGATRSINQRPGGYYTQDDVREVVAYAAERFITVVPEIEMPGHSNAAISAYPQMGNREQIKGAGKDVTFLGMMDNVYNVDDATIRFIKNVLDDIMDLFPGKFIHIGGDEVWKEPWKQNPRAQERMKALGLKDEEELQSWFVKQFDDYLVSKGRRLIGWDEILQGGLAPNAAVMSWRGTEGGIAAAKAGHDVVMSPTSHAYFDYYQADPPTSEPKGIGGYLAIEKVYEFEPVPAVLTADEAKHVLGGQANIWSEFIPHPKHMEYMAYPRLCAMAEVLWSPKESRNWNDFLARLTTHLERLKLLDVNYRPLTLK